MGAVKQLTPEQKALVNLQDLLTRHKDQIAMALPRHMSADRMLRVALTAATTTPALAQVRRALGRGLHRTGGDPGLGALHHPWRSVPDPLQEDLPVGPRLEGACSSWCAIRASC